MVYKSIQNGLIQHYHSNQSYSYQSYLTEDLRTENNPLLEIKNQKLISLLLYFSLLLYKQRCAIFLCENNRAQLLDFYRMDSGVLLFACSFCTLGGNQSNICIVLTAVRCCCSFIYFCSTLKWDRVEIVFLCQKPPLPCLVSWQHSVNQYFYIFFSISAVFPLIRQEEKFCNRYWPY